MQHRWTWRIVCVLAAAALAWFGTPLSAAAFHDGKKPPPDGSWSEEDKRRYAEEHRNPSTDGGGQDQMQAAQAPPPAPPEVPPAPPVPEPPPLPVPVTGTDYDCPPDELPEDVGATVLGAVDDAEQEIEASSGQQLPVDPDGEIAAALGCEDTSGDGNLGGGGGDGNGGGGGNGTVAVLGAVGSGGAAELPRTGPGLPMQSLGAALLATGLAVGRRALMATT